MESEAGAPGKPGERVTVRVDGLGLHVGDQPWTGTYEAVLLTEPYKSETRGTLVTVRTDSGLTLAVEPDRVIPLAKRRERSRWDAFSDDELEDLRTGLASAYNEGFIFESDMSTEIEEQQQTRRRTAPRHATESPVERPRNAPDQEAPQ